MSEYTIKKFFKNMSQPKRLTILLKKPVEIPRYLKKRKTELLKQKILRRKYGYLFYRKTISKILPSAAEVAFKAGILRKSFQKLKLNWFEEKAQWRLILRADLHHHFTTKRNVFCSWQYFVIQKKEKVLKLKIVRAHYNIKLKRRYFIHLKYLRKFNTRHRSLVNSSHKYAIYLFMNINVLTMTCNYLSLRMEYFVSLQSYTVFKTRIVKTCFKHLRLYAEAKRIKKNNKRMVKLFQRLKYNPETLREYFEIWKNFVQICIIKRLKYKIATRHCRNKLLNVYFLQLYAYKERRKFKSSRNRTVNEFYTTLLKRRCLKDWISFTNNKIKKRTKINIANWFYHQILLGKCFHKLLVYERKQKRLKMILLTVESKTNIYFKQRYFLKLRQYVTKRLAKTQKYDFAWKFYNHRLTSKCFDLLRYYSKFWKCRHTEHELLVDSFLKRGSIRTLNNHFSKWKMYVNFELQQKRKLKFANKIFNANRVGKAFASWKSYIKLKNINRIKYEVLHASYLRKLIQSAFTSWKQYFKEEKMYSAMMLQAKGLYDKSLLRDGMKVILAAASEKQKLKQGVALHKMERNFSLSLKYFKMWKYKVTIKLMKGTQKLTQHNEFVKCRQNLYFEWNPICFDPPQIPEYLKLNLLI